MFAFFDHTADLGVRIEADSWTELVEDAARALTAALVVNPGRITACREVEVEVEGDERDYLLLDLLAEVLFLFESEGFVGSEFAAEQRGARLRCRLRGERFDPDRHGVGHDIKAITYHGLSAEQGEDGSWRAEVVVDL